MKIGIKRPVLSAAVVLATAAAAIAQTTSLVTAADNGVVMPAGYSSFTLATGSSTGTPKTLKPDDITYMNGVIYVGYHNGNGKTGTPGPNGPSAVVGYDSSGNQVATWSVVGKIDGLGADTAHNRLLVTVNEDANSNMWIIHPGNPTPVKITYNFPSTGLGSLALTGGTDHVLVYGGKILVAASNPTDNTKPILGEVQNLNEVAGTADVVSSLLGNTPAGSVNSNDPNASSTALNITDPDSMGIVPNGLPGIGGALMIVGEGDRSLVFTSTPSTSVTPTDVKFMTVGSFLGDVVFPTATAGTLYITDTDQNKVFAVQSSNWTVNSAIYASPIKDNVAQAGGFVGLLDLSKGNETVLFSGMTSPAGLLFVPGLPVQAAAPVQAPALPRAGWQP